MNTMNTMNTLLRDGLTSALGALYDLSDAGCTVTSIAVRGGKPVLQLDAPPRGIEGAMRKRYLVGTHAQAVMAAPHRGCQLEWTATPPARRPVDAVDAPPAASDEPPRDTVVTLRRRTTDHRAR